MKNFFKKLIKDESAQGATEYILLLVAVVAMVVIFKDQIKGQVDSLVGKLSGQIESFDP